MLSIFDGLEDDRLRNTTAADQLSARIPSGVRFIDFNTDNFTSHEQQIVKKTADSICDT